MKKLLSIVLALSMIMSLFGCVSVSAEKVLPENIGTDYVPDEATRYSNNMVTAGADGVAGLPWLGDFSYGYNSKGPLVTGAAGDKAYFKPTADINDVLSGLTDPVAGYIVKTAKPAGLSGRVFFSFSLKADQEGKAILINAGRRNESVEVGTDAYVEYPVEYDGPTKGIVPTLGYQTFKGTFADTGAASEKYTYEIGFVNGTVAQGMARIDTAASYIGYEYAYDMTLTAANRELFAGKAIEVSADFINQRDEKFEGDDSITWYATNADRTEAVEGFTFTDNGDGTYSVTVDNTVTAGTYDIVAVSNSNKDIVKGIEVTVTEAPSFDDYDADETTKFANNMITEGTMGLYGPSWGGTDYTYAYNTNTIAMGLQSGNYYYVKTTAAVTDPTASQYHNPALGLNIKTTAPANASGRVIYSLTMKDGNGAKIKIGRRNNSIASDQNPLRVEYPEKLGDGFALTAGYQAFTGVFEDTGAAADKYAYVLGFVEANSGATFRMDVTKAYIGYEYAYDMTVEASDTKLYPGKEITLSADIINQIGNEFGGNAKLNWIAMDANRENTVNGFAFIENEDGTYTATVDATVATGNYDLVAISNANSKLIKGIEVKVSANPYIDYVVDEATRYSNNMITEGTTGLYGPSWGGTDYTYAYNTNTIAMGLQSGNYYFVKTTAAVTDPTASQYHNPALGLNIKTTAPANASGRVIYSLTMKDGNGAKIKIGRRNNSIASDQNPLRVEYPEKLGDGFALTAGYQAFTGVFEDTGAAADKYAYVLGFVEANAQATFRMDITKAYIGYEYAYDMTVEASAETISAGETVNVTASVVNQIGGVYGGTETITWKAMSQDRLSEIEGITITDGVVSVADTVEPGTYDIVAVLGEGVMAKGVPIEVTEKEIPVIEDITIEKTSGGITVSTDEDLTGALLIFVTYENGKMVSVNIDTKVNLDAQGAQEYPIPSGFENAKVMLWSAGFKPLANILN